jgi:hypothetical protein
MIFYFNMLWTVHKHINVCKYSKSQEERSIFREVIVSVILSKKYVYVHVPYSECFSR